MGGLLKTEPQRECIERRTILNNQSNGNQSNMKNIALWVPQVLTAAAFLMAGFAKLSGQPMMVETFDKIGIGQWFRYITGGIEVASAISLLIPRLSPVGAAILVCVMCGAVLTHLLLIGGSPAPALVLCCFAAIVFWGRRGELAAWLARRPG